VCPVKIDIHNQLYQWRQVLTQEGYVPAAKTVAMKTMAGVLSSPARFSFAGKWGRKFLRWFPKLALNKKLNPWAKQRDLPAPPKESFREWYKKNNK
jgi:L-lactate dehydrogenase complex protein LldF